MERYGFFKVSAIEVESLWPRLTDVEKLYFYLLKAEFNYLQSENFRRSDAWFAAAIDCSIPAIRQARRKLQEMGCLSFVPGFKHFGKALAGHYKCVEYEGEGNSFWAKVGFYKLHMLLAHLRAGQLSRSSLLLWLFLEFNRHKFELTGDEFFLTKGQLRDAVRCDDPAMLVKKLYEGFKYSEGSHLFEYTIHFHKVKLCKFADPSEAEKTWDKWRADITSKAAALSQPKPKKAIAKPKTKPGKR